MSARAGCVGDLQRRDLQVRGGNCTAAHHVSHIYLFICWQKPNSRKTGRSPCGDNKLPLLTQVLAHFAIGQLPAPRNAALPQPLMSCPPPTCSMRKCNLFTDSSCSRLCRTKVDGEGSKSSTLSATTSLCLPCVDDTGTRKCSLFLVHELNVSR